ncbi:unnamed protein product [Oncorhynchus mykiss]|uniref:Reverse transcriptase domain-containing protein n=1 Tax=Oncorhynchus mykiss TaxID=8022 RepID=A0A060ZBF5_ONCMY|nr:unnamed protein product [Oncorhynchus mykiss]
MLNTPAILQSKFDALNLTQIINEPTRYNSKSVNTGTLIDVILTNSPSKYTSAVFSQDLSDHCLIACIRNGSATKRPPLITVKRSLKHFCEQAFLIDLARAFDSVNHHILFGRLDSLGFSNDCLAWFTNYFSDRVQCVKSEGLLSGPLAVSMGVPQGSNLRPTLFSVYINDVALAAGDSLVHLYADNTILYTSGPSLDTVVTNLQMSFNAVQLSFRGLQLLLNASKAKCMLFNRSLPHLLTRPASLLWTALT